MKIEGRGWEKALVALVLLWIIVLHLWCFHSAGALWRDESNSILQARLPTWRAMWASLEFDSFPILYPSALRLWSQLPQGSRDSSLRLFGLGTGLGLLASLWVVGRRTSGHLPLMCLALVAADPVLITEGDSIRPYGISLLCILWAFGFLTRYVSRPSLLSLGGAVITSVLAVQTSYINALFIGVLCASAAMVVRQPETRYGKWRCLTPGIAAAVSLLPYARSLRNSSIWASMLHSPIDWRSFIQRYLKDYSPVYPAIWLVSVLFLVFVIAKRCRDLQGRPTLRSAAAVYAVMAACATAVVLILFLEATGIPPFPRYFLPGAILLALALESLLTEAPIGIRAIVVAAAILAGALPTWNWLGQRHTNMDLVAATLEGAARPGDVIVISPWFLHPSFQRYYHGVVEWRTVPDMDRYPMMRYDLVRETIIRNGTFEGDRYRLATTLEGGGAIWFVAQRDWVQLDRHEAPDRPRSVSAPGGRDYVNFRSYWERDIEFRLRACCRGVEVPLPSSGHVRAEEDLLLTRWTAAAK